MIITINAELKKPVLPVDYRPAFVSLIKAALTKHDEAMYQKWYGADIGKSKSFTFSVLLPEAKFAGDTIMLADKNITWVISTSDFSDGIDLYNALLAYSGSPHPLKDNNSATIIKCRLDNQPAVRENEINVRFISPLVVRQHNSDNTDKYLTYDDYDFPQMLDIVVKNQLSSDGFAGSSEIELIPVQPKKTVIKVFGMNVRASLGLFKLRGDAELLNYLFQAGVGSRRNLGFGMFKIL